MNVQFRTVVHPAFTHFRDGMFCTVYQEEWRQIEYKLPGQDWKPIPNSPREVKAK